LYQSPIFLKPRSQQPNLLRSFAVVVILAFEVIAGCSKHAPRLPRLASDAVILAFGDSLTHGTGAKDGESYPEVLESLIGRSVVNRGIPGELSTDGLRRLPGVLEAVEPDLLILCHGGNDILRKKDKVLAENNVREMIRIARERGISVVLLGVPMPGLFLSTAEFYQRIAEDMNVPFEADAIPSTLSDNSLKSDTVHPNAKGYHQIAEAIKKLLTEAGAL
jgi:acyl-CoA thioesterase I